MARIEVAVMEPKYQQNLGYIARISKNFGVERLILINPRCDPKGSEAVKYSKHAVDLLKSASTSKSLKGLKSDLLIGTTGIWHRSSPSYYNIYDPKSIGAIAKKASKSGRRVVILLGREDTGLKAEELSLCDALVFIGADNGYPILNISHALAILLYEFTHARASKAYNLDSFYAGREEEEMLLRLFDLIVKGKSNIRNKKEVSAAFRRIVRRSIPTKKELSALSVALANKNKD